MFPELEGHRKKESNISRNITTWGGEQGVGFGGGEIQNNINTHKSKVIHGHWHRDWEPHSGPEVIHWGSRPVPQASESPEGRDSGSERDPASLFIRGLCSSEPLAGTAGGLPGLHPSPANPRGGQRGPTQLRKRARTQWQLLCASRTRKNKQVPRLQDSAAEVQPNPGQARAHRSRRSEACCADVHKLLRVSREGDAWTLGQARPAALFPRVGGGLSTEGWQQTTHHTGRRPAARLFSGTLGSLLSPSTKERRML